MKRLAPRLAVLLLWAGAALADEPVYSKLTVAGETLEAGIYDPSVEYAPDGSLGWLTYSWVESSVFPFGPRVETHLARTEDAGATWSFVKVVLPALPDSVALDGGPPTQGVWNAEVSSLVHDPNDAGREWKLFAHRIFRPLDPNGSELIDHRPDYSWITFTHAADPAGAWAPEVALFSSGFLPPAPYSTQVAVSALDPNLAELLVYSEPGAFHADGVLYVSLTGLTATGPDRLVLLVSTDHAASWQYAGTSATNADAAALGQGFEKLDGSSIAAQDGRVFLLATPQTASTVHLGTLVFEFEDLDRAKLRRLPGGGLVLHKHVLPQPAFLSAIGGGQSDFHERHRGGMVMPQINLAELPELFQIFDTSEPLVDPPPLPALGRLGYALGACLVGLVALSGAWRRRGRGFLLPRSAPLSPGLATRGRPRRPATPRVPRRRAGRGRGPERRRGG